MAYLYDFMGGGGKAKEAEPSNDLYSSLGLFFFFFTFVP